MLVKRPKSRIKEEKPAYRVQAEQRFQEVRRVGRPPGARNKLSEAFIADLQTVWEDHGPKILQRMLVNEPERLAELVAKLIPREFQVSVVNPDPLSQLDDEALADMQQLLATIRAAKVEGSVGEIFGRIEQFLRSETADVIEAKAIEVE